MNLFTIFALALMDKSRKLISEIFHIVILILTAGNYPGKSTIKNGYANSDQGVIKLISVRYLVSNESDSQYAIVTYILWSGDETRDPTAITEAQIFELHDDRLSIIQQLMWKILFESRASSVSFNKDSSTMTARTIHLLPGDDGFEPSALDIITLRWRGNRFVRTSVYSTLSQEALKAFRDNDRAIRRNPRSAVAFRNRGIAYERKWDNDRAIKDFNRAIRLDAKDALALHFRAIAYYNKKDYEQALKDFSHVIRLTPNDYQAFYNRGITFYQKHDYDKAILDFTQVLKVRLDASSKDRGPNSQSPSVGDALNNRAMAYYEKDDYDRAMQDLRRAIGVDPTLGEQVRGCRLLFRNPSEPSEPGITSDPSSCPLSAISYYLSFRDNIVYPVPNSAP